MRSLVVVGVTLSFAAAIPAAASTNLLINGSFEPSTYPWTVSTFGNPNPALYGPATNCGTFFGVNATDGACQGMFREGAFGLSQLVATTPGTTYRLQYDVANPIGSDAVFSLYWRNAFLPGFQVATGGYQTFEMELTATGTSTLFGFAASVAGRDSFILFDNMRLSIADTAPPGAVPEPGTWALMLMGFGAIGASMRRRRRGEALAAA